MSSATGMAIPSEFSIFELEKIQESLGIPEILKREMRGRMMYYAGL
jgi:hypothetical protein